MRALLTSLVALVAFAAPTAAAPKRLLLVGQGPDGHPAQTHEYVAGLQVLAKCLRSVDGIEIMTVRADEPWKQGPELLERADGVVLFLSEGAKWMQADAQRRAALDKMMGRGGGLVVLHWAMGTKDARPIDDCLHLLGGCHGGPDRKYAVVETGARILDPKHQVAAGIKDFRVKDEFYYRLKFTKAEGLKPLLAVSIEDRDEMVAWTWERPAGGRAFGFSGLHFHDNWRLPEYRRLVAQGVLWTLKMPVPAEGLPVEVTDADLKVNR
jgi:type 1 glutamine amidotransferase